jgi:GTP cyclohydrolase I
METVSTDTQVIENSIKAIFRYIGENPKRAGLIDTPDRMARMWAETMRGYDEKQRPKVTTFQNGTDGICYDGLITDSGNFYSTCEHHFMPFFGQYCFGYVPAKDGKILGLSKVARVVDYFSARLQVQERLCYNIVNYLSDELRVNSVPPRAIGIVMKGEHLCKSMRGVKKQGIMTTSYLLGEFLTDRELKREFLSN